MLISKQIEIFREFPTFFKNLKMQSIQLSKLNYINILNSFKKKKK